MTLKVKQIIQQKEVKLANGHIVKKTEFLTDDNQVLQTFSNIESGLTYEGEITENQFGKLFKKVVKNKGNFSLKSDADAMLIAYAEHIVSALIESGVVKEPKEAAKQIQNFASVFFKVYDLRKSENNNASSEDAPF